MKHLAALSWKTKPVSIKVSKSWVWGVKSNFKMNKPKGSFLIPGQCYAKRVEKLIFWLKFDLIVKNTNLKTSNIILPSFLWVWQDTIGICNFFEKFRSFRIAGIFVRMVPVVTKKATSHVRWKTKGENPSSDKYVN